MTHLLCRVFIASGNKSSLYPCLWNSVLLVLTNLLLIIPCFRQSDILYCFNNQFHLCGLAQNFVSCPCSFLLRWWLLCIHFLFDEWAVSTQDLPHWLRQEKRETSESPRTFHSSNGNEHILVIYISLDRKSRCLRLTEVNQEVRSLSVPEGKEKQIRVSITPEPLCPLVLLAFFLCLAPTSLFLS